MIFGRRDFLLAALLIAGTAAHVLMIWAHRYVQTSVSSPLLLGEPPLVAAGAWIWFGESLGPIEIIGSIAVVASLFGVVRSPDLEEAEAEQDVADPIGPS